MSTGVDGGRTTGSSRAAEAIGAAPEELEREVVLLRRRLAELEHPPPARHRVRQSLAVLLAVLTVLLVVATAVAAWQSRTALDTERFMGVVEPVLESPEVADALGVRLTDEVLDGLALEERLSARLDELGVVAGGALADALELDPAQQARIESLPLPQLRDLAAPIASGLEARIATRIDQFVRSPEFQRLLVEGTELAHTKAVALLRGNYEELPNVEVTAGEVRLNLVPVVAAVLEDLVDQGLASVGIEEIPFIDPFADPEVAVDRLSTALGTDLPPDFGQLTVMSEAELAELQAAARLADQLVWVFALVAIALLALTIAVAPNRRRSLVLVSLGTAAGSVIAMLLLRTTTDEIAATALTPQGRDALGLLATAVFDSLRAVMLVVLVVALLVALAAHLLGRPPWFVRSVAEVRRAVAPKPGGSDLQRAVAGHRDALRVAVLAVGILLLLLFGISLWTVLVVTALVLLAIWGLSAIRAGGPGDGATTAASGAVEEYPPESSPGSPGEGPTTPRAPAERAPAAEARTQPGDPDPSDQLPS